MRTFPTLALAPSDLAMGLRPLRRMSQSVRGGVFSEPQGQSAWGITLTYTHLSLEDTGTLEGFLADVVADGGAFILPHVVDFGEELLDVYWGSAGKTQLIMELEGEGYQFTHLPGRVASVTIDAIEQL